MPSRRLLPALLVALGLLAGCSDPAPDAPTPEPTETATAASTGATETATEESAPLNAADVAFAQAVIVYHAQSSEMHEAILSKSGVPDGVQQLAGTLRNAQAGEADTLSALLTHAGEDPQARAGEALPGLLDEESLRTFFTAAGAEATRLYLEGMQGHHEATLALARDVLTTGSSPEVAAVAEEMVASQEPELAQITELLAASGT